jgi:hypothetical protein
MQYGEAALKDISTHGLALHVDQMCATGTIVIVKFEGLPGPLGDPILTQVAWSTEQPAKAGSRSYLMGCSFSTPLPEKDLKALLEAAQRASTAPVAVQEPPPPSRAQQPDPFLVGSAGEKRRVMRRGGATVPVTLTRSGGGRAVEGAVVDRSLTGLGILVRVPFARGTSLQVRPRDTREKVAAVEVQVSHCRQKGKQWQIGCRFVQTPSTDVLLHLG